MIASSASPTAALRTTIATVLLTLAGLMLLVRACFAQEAPLSYAPADRIAPVFGIVSGQLLLDARLTEESVPITDGLVWRVFGTRAGVDGKLPLIATARGGPARFDLEAGSYLVHAGFGRADATARIDLGSETVTKTMVLEAGGLKLDAMLPDGSTVHRAELRFDIYQTVADGERVLVAPEVPPGRMVRLPAGTYHIVSDYGEVNATIRADIVVEAGKLTEASIEHRAAQVTLNLVRSEDGYPLADTAWSVVGISGEVIAEHVGAYPEMILAAGEYTVVAKHREQIYQRDISVQAGQDVTIRVMATGESPVVVQ